MSFTLMSSTVSLLSFAILFETSFPYLQTLYTQQYILKQVVDIINTTSTHATAVAAECVEVYYPVNTYSYNINVKI